LLDRGLELLGSMNGPTMHDPPIVGLLPQFDIFATQASHFLAQFEHLAPELLHEVQEISRLSGREKINKRAVHDKKRLYPKSTGQTRRTNRSNRSGEGLPLAIYKFLVRNTLRQVDVIYENARLFSP
jgi:hypothetical protein